VVCNSLRRALDGRVAFVDLVRMLNRTIGLVDFFIQVFYIIALIHKFSYRYFVTNILYVGSAVQLPVVLLLFV